MWYSARIRYVFRENGREYVKVKFEGFSKAYDETVPTDMLNKFRPHLGPETSADSRKHRMYNRTRPPQFIFLLISFPHHLSGSILQKYIVLAM